MAVEPLNKSVTYKGHVITIRRGPNDTYVYTITPLIQMELSGIAMSLPEAFEKARAMIDKLEDKMDE